MATRPLVSLTVLFAVFISVVAGGTAVAGATTQAGNDDVLTVDDDGGADYTTIQDAVDDANPGDRIEVAEGTYDSVVIDKRVTIAGDPGSGVGSGPAAPTVTNESGVAIKFTDDADGARLVGLNVRPVLRAQSPTGISLEHLNITGLSGFDGDLITSGSATRVELRSSVVKGYIELVRPTEVEIRNNRLSESVNPRGTAEDIIISGNEFRGGSIYMEPFDSDLRPPEDFGSVDVSNVSITDNTGDGYLNTYSGNWTNVTIADNRFSGAYWAPVNATDMELLRNRFVASGITDGYFILDISGDGVGEWYDVRVAQNEVPDGGFLLFLDEGRRFEDTTVVDNRIGGTEDGLEIFADGCRGSCDRGSPTTLRNVTFARNVMTEENDGELYLFATGTTIRNVSIRQNRAQDMSRIGGIDVFIGQGDVKDLLISGNRFNGTEVGVDRNFGISYSTGNGLYLGLGRGEELTAENVTVDGNRFADMEVGTGVIVAGNASSADINVTNNVVTNMTRPTEVGELNEEDVDRIEPASSVKLFGGGNVDLNIRGNVFDRGQYGIFVTEVAGSSTVSARANQFSKLSEGVVVTGPGTAGTVSVRGNNFLEIGTYGVRNDLSRVVDARANYWGAASGPGNRSGGPLADPVTGAPANGTGAAVSEGPTDDLANVRFDLFAAEPIDLDDPNIDVPSGDESLADESPDQEVRDEPEPRFVYEGTIDPEFIDAGEMTVVNVTVTNEGDAAGEYEGQLSTGFDDLVARPGELGPGESQNLSFEVSFAEVSINQLFVDGDYIGKVEVEQPSPAELTRRHLEVEGAYSTRWAVTEGSTYEIVATVQNTDDEPHEFEIPFETYRTDAPADSRTRTVETTQSVVLRSGERRTIRQEVTVDEAVDGPRGATTFVADVPASNMTVVPESELPSGLTKAYTVPSDANGYDYEVVAVYHNPGDTAETFTANLFPPRYEEELPLLEATDMVRIESVTVPPGETRRLRVGVDTAQSDEGQGVWTVDGRPAPLVVDAEAE